MTSIFISTGEVSGDLQGALLIEALWRQAHATGLELEISALGGDRMAAAGAKLIANTTSIGSVGILESVPFVLPTWKIQRRAKQYLQQNPPDILVLIDYMGPNLALGKYVHQHLAQTKIVYFIAPQEWVFSISDWNTKTIVEITDRLLAIFPEEARYFQQQGAETVWVGHPMVERMQNSPTRETARELLGIAAEQRVIALLPASRQQEIKYMLPLVCAAAREIQEQLPEVEFLIPLSLPSYRGAIERAIQEYGLSARVIEGKNLEAIAAADLAIAKSGTVNLEIAWLDVPQVVFYRVNPLTAWIATHIFKFSIAFMSPANLLVMKPIVPELLQEEATPARIVTESLALLLDESKRQKMLQGYGEMRASLGELGVCDRAAGNVIDLLIQVK